MRLIDADELLKYANGEITSAFAYPQGQRADDEKAYREMWTNIRNILLSAPTIEPFMCDTGSWQTSVTDAPPVEYAPIKHGHWIWRGGNLYECSECGAIVVVQDYIPIELHYFCRGCGAKMDEDK